MSRKTISIEEVEDMLFHAKSALDEAHILIGKAERELEMGLRDLRWLREQLPEQEIPNPEMNANA